MHLESLELRCLLAGDGLAPPVEPAAGPDPTDPPLIAAEVHGMKWNDLNGNGRRESDEPGLAGVAIYSDLNNNGLLDDDEPSTRTLSDNPATDRDETGEYRLGGLGAGGHLIREVIPDGFVQTFPGFLEAPPSNDDAAPDDNQFSAVRPEAIRAAVAPGQSIDRTVAITIFPNLLVPIDIDVVSSDDNVHVTNRSGIQTNGGGGDTTQFELSILHHRPTQRFELQFVDTASGDVIDTIPVWLARPGEDGAHLVRVDYGDVVEGLDFGNQAAATDGSAVSGRKWNDLNGNGRQDGDEPGLAGVLVYSDLNRNGMLDRNEPVTETQRDNPQTRFDETGLYMLEGLRPGTHTIREVVPRGYIQTFPSPRPDAPNAAGEISPNDRDYLRVEPAQIQAHLPPGGVLEQEVSITIFPNIFRPITMDVVSSTPLVTVVNYSGVQTNGGGGDTTTFDIAMTLGNTTDPFTPPVLTFELQFVDVDTHQIVAAIPVTLSFFPLSGGHTVTLEPGDVVGELNFGNHRAVPTAGVSGRKWNDADGNGERNGGEEGLGGVTIYADLNRNGVLDRGEPSMETLFDNPITDFDESGLYHLELPPGEHVIREVVPDGYQQTFPRRQPEVIRSETGRFREGHAIDFDLTDVQWVDDPATPDGSTAVLEMTVVWPDGCGDIIEDMTDAAVIGDIVVVEMSGRQVPGPCPEVITPQTDTVRVNVPDRREFQVVGTLHESIGDLPALVPTLAFAAVVGMGQGGAHVVSLDPDEFIDGIDFGNQPLFNDRTAVVEGTKWNDRDGNGRRDPDEPGLSGVVIYADLNNNGTLDRNEPSTVTGRSPASATPENGHYRLRIPAGRTVIREVVPYGYVQTYPAHGPDGLAGHVVEVQPGDVVSSLDFGNTAEAPELGSIQGIKWLDVDGDGRRDNDEPGLGGVTVYLDANNNGQLDPNERSTVTWGGEDPADLTFPTGHYVFSDLEPGTYVVREVVPDGYSQSFPRTGYEVLFSEAQIPRGSSALDFRLIDVAEAPTAGPLPGVALTFEIVWRDSCGNLLQEETTFDVDGNQITVEMHAVEEGPACLLALTPETQTIIVTNPAPGENHVRATLLEQTFDGQELTSVLEAAFVAGGGGGHIVELRSGARVHGVDFGNEPVIDPTTRAVFNGSAPIGEPGDGSSWDDPNNWTSGGVVDVAPNENSPGMHFLFGDGSVPTTVVLGGERLANSVHFNADYTLDHGTLTVSSGALRVMGDAVATIGTDASVYSGLNVGLHKTGRGTLDIDGKVGAISVNDGTVGGNGHAGYVGVRGGGRLSPGDSNGDRVIGEFQATSAEFNERGVYHVDVTLDGDRLGADLLNVEHQAVLGGRLDIDWLADSARLPQGAVMTVPIVQAASIHGRFDATSRRAHHLGAGLFYDVIYRETEVLLRIYRAVPGDANADGIVSTDDFNHWNENNFQRDREFPEGDFNNDGIVDGSDMNIWLANRFSVVPAMIQLDADTGIPRAALAGRPAAGDTANNRSLIDAALAGERPLSGSLLHRVADRDTLRRLEDVGTSNRQRPNPSRPSLDEQPPLTRDAAQHRRSIAARRTLAEAREHRDAMLQPLAQPVQHDAVFASWQ